MRNRSAILGILLMGSVQIGPLIVRAAPIYVNVACGDNTWSGSQPDCVEPTGPKKLIQAAINIAQDDDVIIVAAGSYRQALNFFGKPVTIQSADGPQLTIIDGSGSVRTVVLCDSGERSDSVLNGFTITSGSGLIGPFPTSTGGGMFISGSSPTVINCIFLANSAEFGGAVFINANGNPTFINCQFLENEAASNGGGMYTTASSHPVLDRCVFHRNRADLGGGMFNTSQSTSSVTNSIFSENSARNGGGMFNSAQAAPTITNCVFFDNFAAIDGGALFNEIITTPLITNTIFWENEPMSLGGTGEPTIIFSNLEMDLDLGEPFPGPGNISADPIFVDVSSGDLRLLPGSPCIDAGIGILGLPLADMDGNVRVLDDLGTPNTGLGDPPIDMGPYEFGSELAPTNALPADLDKDGDVDGIDFVLFASCFNGAGRPPRSPGCPTN